MKYVRSGYIIVFFIFVFISVPKAAPVRAPSRPTAGMNQRGDGYKLEELNIEVCTVAII